MEGACFKCRKDLNKGTQKVGACSCLFFLNFFFLFLFSTSSSSSKDNHTTFTLSAISARNVINPSRPEANTPS
jgi:hypothetical protein